MKRFASILTLLVVGWLTVGGAVYWWQHSRLQKVTDEVLRVKQSEQSLKSQVLALESDIAALRQFKYTARKAGKADLLRVYNLEFRTVDHLGKEYRVVDFYVGVPPELPLLQKLRLLADKMSVLRFNSLPLDVLRIETRAGKRIAVIGIREPENDQYAWGGGYFQGSTGGGITQVTLVESFLQRGYTGDWIDGVEFYYQGKPFTDEWDHINLSGVRYR